MTNRYFTLKRIKEEDWRAKGNKIPPVESEFLDECPKTGWYWKVKGSESFQDWRIRVLLRLNSSWPTTLIKTLPYIQPNQKCFWEFLSHFWYKKSWGLNFWELSIEIFSSWPHPTMAISRQAFMLSFINFQFIQIPKTDFLPASQEMKVGKPCWEHVQAEPIYS